MVQRRNYTAVMDAQITKKKKGVLIRHITSSVEYCISEGRIAIHNTMSLLSLVVVGRLKDVDVLIPV
jgi:hypothetical protein